MGVSLEAQLESLSLTSSTWNPAPSTPLHPGSGHPLPVPNSLPGGHPNGGSTQQDSLGDPGLGVKMAEYVLGEWMSNGDSNNGTPQHTTTSPLTTEQLTNTTIANNINNITCDQRHIVFTSSTPTSAPQRSTISSASSSSGSFSSTPSLTSHPVAHSLNTSDAGNNSFYCKCMRTFTMITQILIFFFTFRFYYPYLIPSPFA